MEETRADFAIVGGEVVSGGHRIQDGVVLVSDGQIAAVGPRWAIKAPETTPTIDAAGAWVLPGFIDTHIHGCQGDDVMDASVEGLRRMASRLCQYGVTSFLPTTITASHEETMAAIRRCH